MYQFQEGDIVNWQFFQIEIKPRISSVYGSLLLESTIKACRSMWFQKWDVLSIHISSKKRKVDKYMMTGLCSTETDYKIIKVDFPPSVISVYFH